MCIRCYRNSLNGKLALIKMDNSSASLLVSPWVRGGWQTVWQTVLTCRFHQPKTEMPQMLKTSNFLHNHSKSWTACVCHEICITHLLLLQATNLSINRIYSSFRMMVQTGWQFIFLYSIQKDIYRNRASDDCISMLVL